MNDKEEKELIRTAKNKAIGIVVGACLAGIGAMAVFYFTGTAALAQNTTDIKELKADVKKIKTVPVLNQKDIKQVQKEVTEIKENQKDFQKETKESIDDLRKQNLKMLEILYQIKRQND